MEDQKPNRREEIYSKRVKAGKRTYFIDVKPTKGQDYYITITESKRRFDESGYDKHKIFVYKEDFNKFSAGLAEVIEHVKTELMPEYDFSKFDKDQLANAAEDVKTYDNIEKELSGFEQNFDY